MAGASLTAGFQHRVRDWALRRQGTDALPLTLAARRIYILPTRAGWSFAALVMVMFIAGMNYGNGLALLFTFWLTGFALVAMVQTHRNLSGTQVLAATAHPAFAGAQVMVSIEVLARGSAADLVLSCGQQPASAHVAESSSGLLRLPIVAKRRGPWQAPPLQLASTAPYGLFRTWTWLTPVVTTLVYPHPAGDLPVPETSGDDGGTANMVASQDELAWLREFREGDSPRQVAWKAYARGAPLLVREYRGHAMARRDFDFSLLRIADVEARLSQLTRWCIDAAARGEHWTLRLPGAEPLTGSGPAHLTACLRQLALHAIPGNSRA